MGVRVVDASALGALVFGEPKAEAIAETLVDGPVVAPALIWFELASICLGKLKAHPAQERQILQAFGLAHRLAIQVVEVEQVAVVELARKTGLTTYDASYLWLARHLPGDLVTLDRRMLAAAVP